MADHVTGFATDVANTQFAGAMDPDSIMRAVFYMRACKNEWLSEKEGRPVYEDRIYCRYGPAGSTLLEMDVRSTSEHERRFPRQWAAFQAGQDAEAQKHVGTPLKEWPLLTPSVVEELRDRKFYTVENIAGASDDQLAPLGMGFMDMGPFTLREKAKAYLQAARDSALPQKQAGEIAALKDEMARRDEEHKRELEELRALILASQAPKKKRGEAAQAEPAAEEKTTEAI